MHRQGLAAPAAASAVLTGMADEITCAIRDTDRDSLYILSLAIMAATLGLVRALAAGGRVPGERAGFRHDRHKQPGFVTTGISSRIARIREIEDTAPSIASPISNEAT